MEHPAAVSRRKLQKVYTLVHEPTRAKLKTIAGLQGIRLFDLLDTLALEYIRGWEKRHKIDLSKLATQMRSSSKKTAQRVKA